LAMKSEIGDGAGSGSGEEVQPEEAALINMTRVRLRSRSIYPSSVYAPSSMLLVQKQLLSSP